MENRCFGCMHIKHGYPHCEFCGFDERSHNQKHQLPIGTEVGGQYILGRVLGQGGFGITYIGWDKVMEQTVAVKEYFPSGFAGRDTHDLTVSSYDDQNRNTFESNKQRFLREAESLGKLWNIPQIVKVLRCFEENGTAYIAMEYVEGMDLRKYLKQLGRPMTIEETIAILGPVMEALDHVHKANLVHRDISPDNIMVLPDGSAKLLDFGAARYVENADAEKDRATSTQAILKHGFAPPEQYQSHGALGPWTDVYAMCATIYYCLTGKVPPEAMARVMEGQEINWNRISALTKNQIAALQSGMSIQPKDRPSSIHKLHQLIFYQYHKDTPSRQKTPSSKKWFIAPTLGILMIILCIITASNKTTFPVTSSTNSTESTLEETQPAYTLTYEHQEGGVTITGYEGTLPETLMIPQEIDGLPIISIGNDAFFQDIDLFGISLPEGITSIEESAFYGCSNLANISIPKSVNYIGANAFWACTQLTSIAIPDGVTSIEISTFAKCTNLTRISIPDSVTSIGRHAFSDCAQLEELVIPSNITYIGDSAFTNCAKINRISIPDGVSSIGDYTFSGCSSLIAISIPNSITSIGTCAFSGCTSLTHFFFPKEITFLGNGAFSGCSSLKKINFPTGVSSINSNTFNGCSNLQHITIPDGVTYIGSQAFSSCIKLNNIIIPKSVSEIGFNAFSECTSLNNIKIPWTCQLDKFTRSNLNNITYY